MVVITNIVGVHKDDIFIRYEDNIICIYNLRIVDWYYV